MSAWPSIAWTERRSAPPSSRWLANEWRSMWGETRPRTPARPAWARLLEVARHPPDRLGADRHQPLLASLAGADEVPGRAVHVLPREVEALRGTHPGRVQELEDRPVADALGPAHVRGLHERGRDLAREGARQRPAAARQLEVLGRIVREVALAEQVAVEAPERRDAARDA